MTKYDNQNSEDRKALASDIIFLLAKSGFKAVTIPGTEELTFERKVDNVDNMRVRVYTTIASRRGSPDLEVRKCGTDAIRVITIYKAKRDGKERALAKANHKVYRTGERQGITERMITRMRECYRVGLTNPNKCNKCGAPTFQSKAKRKKVKGKMTIVKRSNVVCAELCWLR